MPTKLVTYSPSTENGHRGHTDEADTIHRTDDSLRDMYLLHVDEDSYYHLLQGGIHKEDLTETQYKVLKEDEDGTKFSPPSALDLKRDFGTDDEKTITERMVRFGKLENP